MRGCIAAILLAILTTVSAARAEDQAVEVFNAAVIGWEKERPDGPGDDGLMRRSGGQAVERVVQLPIAPADQRDARRIVARIDIAPILSSAGGKPRPIDPWTRLGSLSLLWTDKPTGRVTEIELVRFITAFGGTSSITQDLTALAPLLSGDTTLRAYISTWSKDAWRISVTLTLSAPGAGYRRPALALPLFFEPNVVAGKNRLAATVSVPRGLEHARIRILTTGHATDGTGGDEFITRTHVLRVDGREVARWRPWCEGEGDSRSANPTSGRQNLDGRELWSCDLDRSGWAPGRVVQPCLIPLPELSSGGGGGGGSGGGSHRIELEILDIRPEEKTASGTGRGYWRVSAILVADQPWPLADEK